MKKGKTLRPRTAIQILFLFIILIISINHGYEKDYGTPLIGFLSTSSLHAICPFGGIETLYSLIFQGSILKEIRSSAFVLMGIVLVLSVLFGPVFCGWICPFGTLQEFIGKLGKKIFKNKYNNTVPDKLDNVLRYARYLVLAYIIYITAKSGYLIFKDYDPYSTLFNLWREFTIGGLAVLIFTVILSLFIERPWCKYICPYGAMLGITNFFRIFKLKRNDDRCISCNLCDKACPMNISIADTSIVKNHQCITCLECTADGSCPKEDTLELYAGNLNRLEKGEEI